MNNFLRLVTVAGTNHVSTIEAAGEETGRHE